MKRLILFRFFILLFVMCPFLEKNVCAQQINNPVELTVHWQIAKDFDVKSRLPYELILTNNGQMTFTLSDWDLMFNSMFPVIGVVTDEYTIEDLTGNLIKITFGPRKLNPKESLRINYLSKYPIPGKSTAPIGFYFINNKNYAGYFPVKSSYSFVEREGEVNKDYLSSLYEKNKSFEFSEEDILIFPTPKKLEKKRGSFVWKPVLKVFGNDKIVKLLRQELSRMTEIIEVPSRDDADIRLVDQNVKVPEGYTLQVFDQYIEIGAKQYAGFLYGIKSLKSLYRSCKDSHNADILLPCLSVEDEPRYAYRGFMMDIARNFRNKDFILKYIDLMAEYKLNVFHFHFIEDEAWRLEIPGLPELIEVGARRSPLYGRGDALLPAYGSSTDTQREFLARADFIEILQYAHQRNIQVVPEIETPGHARAAIYSMLWRYNRLMKEGKADAAVEYLLHDLEDQSVYSTPQNYVDNVLNPALPSVYTFLDKVLDEIKLMYQEAGVPFVKVSLGGDEVPRGVWEKSPKIAALMKQEGLKSVHDVWTYYIHRINQMCISKGIQLAGWEEIGMVNKGNGMDVNFMLADKQNMQLDVWNNVIGGGQEDLVYRLANAGYPTVLISASNTYFDMMWDTSFEEPGLNWATYADLYHSYSLFPEDYFANIHTYYSGARLDKAYINKLTRINEKGRSHFLGIKGGLFAETLLTDDQLDYIAFPRFFALVERAWSPKRTYENEERFSKALFDRDYASFLKRVSTVELPSLQGRVAYRLPRVAIKQEGDKILYNTEYPGFDIYYTWDGSVPTLNSQKAVHGQFIPVQSGKTISMVVLDKDGRSGQVSQLKVD